MSTRAGDPFVCIWCVGGVHSRCLGPVCECLHVHEAWLTPDRRAELRNGLGEPPRNVREAEYRRIYRHHQEVRRAADTRRS